jgi:transcriptional regulator with XRE-family HTH domain
MRKKPIHHRVKECVDAAGVSNAELARKTGWHELRVWRLLSGKTDLTAEDMEVIARILKCDVADLYRGAEATGS